jgi:hypothetical protein
MPTNEAGNEHQSLAARRYPAFSQAAFLDIN